MKKSQQQVSAASKARIGSTLRLSRFAQSFLREWKKLDLPGAGANAVIAVSGGADSVAMLLALHELVAAKRLKLGLLVAHLDHGLRKDSRADARWVANLAKRLGHDFVGARVDVTKRAAKTGDNLEQAARRARYDFLAKAAKKNRADLVIVGHTMDDQAETVLLNLLRGSGMDGLTGMDASRSISEGSGTALARPLLSWARRRDTESHCRLREVDARVDQMNSDDKFSRVRVRRQLLPLMESFNPKIVQGLTRTADLLREDGQALNQAAERLLELSRDNPGSDGVKGTRLRTDLLAFAPTALRHRALRRWIGLCRGSLARIERVHVLAVETLLFGDRGGRVVELPGGSRISRTRGLLIFKGLSSATPSES